MAEVIVFDAVGTLIYADPPVVEVYCEAGERHGAALSVEEVSHRFSSAFHRRASESLDSNDDIERHRWRSLVAEVFHETPVAHDLLFNELWLHFAQPQSWKLFEDVLDCLADLRNRSIRIAVASNFDERLPLVCDGFELLRELQLFWSADIGFAKPHPQFFRTIESRIGIFAEQLTLVGDDVQADYMGAQAAGWKAVLLDRDGQHDQPSIATLAELALNSK